MQDVTLTVELEECIMTPDKAQNKQLFEYMVIDIQIAREHSHSENSEPALFSLWRPKETRDLRDASKSWWCHDGEISCSTSSPGAPLSCLKRRSFAGRDSRSPYTAEVLLVFLIISRPRVS